MRDEEKRGWIALQMVPGLGPVMGRRLIERFGSPEGVFRASAEDLRGLPRLPERVRQAIASGPDDRKIEHSLAVMRRLGAWIITLQDPEYPTFLREIHDPPLCLYGCGDPGCLDRPGVAVVGSRRPTSYGLKIARVITADVARAGMVIISGLAQGIDTVAHRSACDAGGMTIAVKGCGIDVAYPRSNTELVKDVVRKGAVVTEFPVGTAPEPRNFPGRNRIISGLSKGVLVVEAGLKSGSLITASYALDQGRSVMAVPGPVASPMSAGTHWLIKQGARLVESAIDVFDELGHPAMEDGPAPATAGGGSGGSAPPDLSPEELAIYEQLEDGPRHLDDLAHLTALPVSRVSGLLMRMALKDAVRVLPGQCYQRNS